MAGGGMPNSAGSGKNHPGKFTSKVLLTWWFDLIFGYDLGISGIFVANLLNYFSAKIKAGRDWRLSFGGAVVPGLIILFGSFWFSDTPNSLLECNKFDEAKDLLIKIRGFNNVDEEFNDLANASEAAKIVFVFYASVLLKSMGFGNSGSLMSAMITSSINALATLVSTFTVDKSGRTGVLVIFKSLIILYVFVLIFHHLIIYLYVLLVMTIAIASKFGTSGNPGQLPMWFSGLVVVAVICIYIADFAWSWGPLGWLVHA
ncbi:hypothetical protein CRYUN_Cryun13aG0123600 [Craigia yunnanensis]